MNTRGSPGKCALKARCDPPAPIVVLKAARPAVFWFSDVDIARVGPQLNPYLVTVGIQQCDTEL